MHAITMPSNTFKKQILSIVKEKASNSVLSKELFEGLDSSKTMI